VGDGGPPGCKNLASTSLEKGGGLKPRSKKEEVGKKKVLHLVWPKKKNGKKQAKRNDNIEGPWMKITTVT